jgi:hypothetical protein
LFVLPVLASFALSGVARAQAESMAIAEGLFRDGRALLDHGRVDEACDKFEASQRMSPAVGTQLNLAICREKQGKTATAWSLFAEVESVSLRAGDETRAGIAHQHGTALASQLKKVVIEVPTPPPGMVLKLDGVVLPSGALGTEIPLDPGSHAIVATAPGKKKWEQASLNLGPSATTVHVRVELESDSAPASSDAAPLPVSAEPAPAVDPKPAPEAPPDRADVDAHPSSHPDTLRLIGYGVGGVGLVALGVAAYYGFTALSRKNDEANYPAGSADRLVVYNQASGAQTAELAVGAFGLVCVGAGLYLVLTSHGGPSAPAPQATSRMRVVPTAGPGGGGVMLTGAF